VRSGHLWITIVHFASSDSRGPRKNVRFAAWGDMHSYRQVTRLWTTGASKIRLSSRAVTITKLSDSSRQRQVHPPPGSHGLPH
jgi:hypothetical protein